MGTRMALNYAIIFMHDIEEQQHLTNQGPGGDLLTIYGNTEKRN